MNTILMKRIAIVALIGAAAVWGSVDGAAEERLADARAAVSQWVDVERTISREALAWEDKKTLLGDLITVAKTEIESLKHGIAEADKATGVAEARRAELVKERDENAALAEAVKTFLPRMEERLRGLLARLPKPLVDKLEALKQRMPADSADTSLGIAQRMQTVMGFIAEIQRFDTMVTVGEELRESAQGETREVRTIHFGLGASFYVAADDADAGIGRATPEGWTWQSQPELAAAVREAITTAEGRQREARFLSLPVTLKEVSK